MPGGVHGNHNAVSRWLVVAFCGLDSCLPRALACRPPGVLIMESLEHAQKRGATILAEYLGGEPAAGLSVGWAAHVKCRCSSGYASCACNPTGDRVVLCCS